MVDRYGPNSTGFRAVRHGDTIYASGVTAEDRSADIVGQTTQILDKIGRILADAGSDRSCLLSATVYLKDMAMKAGMQSAWTAWFDPARMPARATIGVADLGPDVLIEVVTTACAVK